MIAVHPNWCCTAAAVRAVVPTCSSRYSIVQTHAHTVASYASRAKMAALLQLTEQKQTLAHQQCTPPVVSIDAAPDGDTAAHTLRMMTPP